MQAEATDATKQQTDVNSDRERKTLNRLPTGMGRYNTNVQKWGYVNTTDKCGCDKVQDMDHLHIHLTVL